MSKQLNEIPLLENDQNYCEIAKRFHKVSAVFRAFDLKEILALGESFEKIVLHENKFDNQLYYQLLKETEFLRKELEKYLYEVENTPFYE